MSLLTLGILAIIFVIVLVAGFIVDEYNDDLKSVLLGIGVVGCLLIGIVGFGVYASLSKRNMIVEEIVPQEIVKSKTKIYVEFDGTTSEFETKKDFDEINDSTTFFKVTYLNHYGFEQSEFITYDKTFEKYVGQEKVESVFIK